MPRDAKDLLHGTLDLLVLRALATEPMHGFALSKWIDQRTSGELGIVDSALYKSLHRLEDAGAVLAEWGASENNRRAQVLLAVRARPADAAQRDRDVETLRRDSHRRTRARVSRCRGNLSGICRAASAASSRSPRPAPACCATADEEIAVSPRDVEGRVSRNLE